MTTSTSALTTFRLVIDDVLQRGVAIDLPGTPDVGKVLREERGKAYRVVGAKRLESGISLLYLVTAPDA